MKVDLNIDRANDYARDIGAATYHPHVAIINYSELGEIRHTLNRFNVYALFLQNIFPEDMVYGIGSYARGKGSLLAYAPGQIGGKADDGTRRQYDGWVLMFDDDFISGTEISRRLADYHFFSYNINEALYVTDNEKATLYDFMEKISIELSQHAGNAESDNIVRDYILLLLDYCKRFYNRQFADGVKASNDLLARFQQVLIDYYRAGCQAREGVPSVRHCASELCLSPNYFGDLIRETIGESPRDYIRRFVITLAKSRLLGGETVSEVSEALGFEYPQHFTRVFKRTMGITPSQFVIESKKP